MQNGVFAPPHLLLYLLPISLIPYAFMLVTALQTYLAYCFAYLYARLLGLRLFSGIFAAVIFISFAVIRSEPRASGIYLPLLLCLAELRCRGYGGLVRLILPWATALSFLGGHFESAFYVNFVAGCYYSARVLGLDRSPRAEKVKNILEFAGLMSLGILLAGIQIVPALEYHRLSYNRVWHDPRWFGFWDFETIGKHLTWEDAGLVAVGLAALGLFIAALKKSLATKEKHPNLARLAAGVFLALAIACLLNLGMNDPAAALFLGDGSLINRLWFLFVFFIAMWGWCFEQDPGLRILGFICIGSVILLLKLPPLTNVLYHVPPFGNFHNGSTHRWEMQLSVAVLGAAALQRWASLGPERYKAVLRAWPTLCIFLLGYLGAGVIRNPIYRVFPASIAFPDVESTGGIIGPRAQTGLPRTQAVEGWVQGDTKPSKIVVQLMRENKILEESDVTRNAGSRDGRTYFDAYLRLPPGAASIQTTVIHADGSTQTLKGTEFSAIDFGNKELWLLFSCVALFPLLFLLGPRLVPLVAVIILAAALNYRSSPMAADDIPYKLDGFAQIKKDPDLFRVASLHENFLRADYLNDYNVADIRTGGDFLDLLSAFYFYKNWRYLVSVPTFPQMFEVGLKVLGIANVKYLIDGPETAAPHPSAKVFARSADVTIFKNEFALPRAVFFDRYVYLPVSDMEDFLKEKDFEIEIAQWLGRNRNLVQDVLVLQDLPAKVPESPENGQIKPAVVTMGQYDPDDVTIHLDAPHQGLLFLSDNFYPGWKAFVNGEETRILRSWMTFRAVEVPAGKSTVVFLYRPIRVIAAILLSACLCLLWVGAYRKHWLEAAPAVLDPQAHCAWIIERIVALLAIGTIAFWTLWSAFVFGGGIQNVARPGKGLFVNLAGAVILVIFAMVLAHDCRLLWRGRTKSHPAV